MQHMSQTIFAILYSYMRKILLRKDKTLRSICYNVFENAHFHFI